MQPGISAENINNRLYPVEKSRINYALHLQTDESNLRYLMNFMSGLIRIMGSLVFRLSWAWDLTVEIISCRIRLC